MNKHDLSPQHTPGPVGALAVAEPFRALVFTRPRRYVRVTLVWIIAALVLVLAGCATGGASPSERPDGGSASLDESRPVSGRSTPILLRPVRDRERGRIVLSYSIGANGVTTSLGVVGSSHSVFAAPVDEAFMRIMHLAAPQ